MGKKNREQLKERFRRGRMPSEEDFADLVDSMLNMLEDGFDRTPEDGVQITQLESRGKLMSFYEDLAVEAPRWFLDLREQQDEGGALVSRLRLNTPALQDDKRCALTISTCSVPSTGRVRVGVGIDVAHPRCELDVVGVVAAHGRMGQERKPVPADGQWHDLTGVLTGCNAFELVAGIGAEDSVGRYALVHAVVLNAFGSRNGVIDARHAWFGGRSSRIELRWSGVPEEGRFAYRLEMRADPAYGGDRNVNCHLTRLWFDPLMEASLGKGPVA